MGFQDSKSNIYGDDGSTSTEAFLVGTDLYVASAGRPQGVISKAGKDDDSTASATGTHLFATVVSEAILLDTGKGEPYQRTDMDSESHTSCYDGLATEKAISLCTDIFSQAVKPMSGEDGHLVGGNVVVEAVISKAGEGEPDSHGSQAVILKELISKDCKGGPYLHYERDTYRDDGSTTKEAISLCNDPIVTPTVIPMSGKGETCQRTICVGSLDSESNTCHDDGSILGCDRTDRSTTTMGLTCENSGGSRVLILGDSQGKAQPSSMERLPSDIIQEILSWVPAESVLDCKLVCKKWVTLIRGSNFANMHLSRLLDCFYDVDDGNDNLSAKVEPCLFFACRIDDPDLYRTLLFNGGQLSDRISSNDEKYVYSQNLERIYHPPMHEEPLSNHLVGSCNGLVCAFQHHHLVIDPIYICNPLTREYVYLPQLFVKDEDLDPDRFRIEGEGPELGAAMYNRMASGFGYVRSTNEYKVVRIHYLDYEEGTVEVYTLGSGCGWRSVGIIPYRLDTSRFGMGVYVNDAIYWTRYDKVVSFDLAKEEFRVLPDPPCMRNRQYDDRKGLVALGRHLCLYMDKLNVEIWSLMEGSESEETWHMECDIDYEAVVGSREMNFRPILLTKKGEIIFLYDESVLYGYDTKTTFLKMISDEASADYFHYVEVIAHVNTFTSLEAIGENSKRYTVRPRRVRTPWDDVINELDRVALGEEIDTTRFRLG